MLVVTPKVAIERTRDETLEGDIGEQERDEMMAFWRETKGLRPVKPFQWFPIKNEHNGVERDSNLKRTIFCATSGHTGTKLLTRILKTCSGVYSIHEPNKVENSLAGPYLGMANDYPMNKTVQNRSHKINLIRNGLKRGKVYAETSNMFIKTFYDLVLSQEDFDVDIVILRRSLPKVFRSRTHIKTK